MIREIVSIDERLCNGSGGCVPAGAEGAIQIIGGKAGPRSDTLCDGLGACLKHCPQGAIKIERREAPARATPRKETASDPLADLNATTTGAASRG